MVEGRESFWHELCLRELPARQLEYQKLMDTEDPEGAPYDSRYKAGQLQQDLIDKALSLKDIGTSLCSDNVDERIAFNGVLGRLHIQRGLALVTTDLLTEAETSLIDGLAFFSKVNKFPDMCLLLAAHNNLGMLYCNRADLDKAAGHLKSAEEAYFEWKASLAGSNSVQAKDAQGQNRDIIDECEGAYTLTQFYLAQVYQKQGNEDQAAEYCAHTLKRQIHTEESLKGADLESWIQNAAQLSCYFFNHERFAEAEHLLNSATAMLRKAQAFNVSLEDEIAANVDIGWVRYYLARMEASIAKDSKTPHVGASELQESLHFECLDVPATETLPWGERALAVSFDSARDLFNASMRHIRSALAFYKLDGWVSEHVQLLFDAAQAYRTLAWFEQDLHRKCVMHRHRVKQFDAVSSNLSAKHFFGLVCSIQLECANAFRDIWELKATAGWPERKVALAGAEASKHYDLLLDQFREVGRLPVKLDADWERPVLSACLSQARILSKAKGPSAQADLEKAREALEFVSTYVKENEVKGMEGEAKLCDEFRALVIEKAQTLSAMRHG